MNNAKRLDTLDFFRLIAILSVMLFHYYSRWNPPESSTSLYPFGSKYNFFQWGRYGVEFFFIISGFVITYTLHATKTVGDFWKRRFIRLFPAMVIASLITYLVMLLLDKDKLFIHGHSLLNFLVSITFLPPDLLNKIVAPLHVQSNYLSGSYWSLWPEIQFYFLASTIYFLNKRNFTRNFTLFSIGLFLLNLLMYGIDTNKLHIHIPGGAMASYKFWLGSVFNLPFYMPWFLSGVLLHEVFFQKATKFIWGCLLVTAALGLCTCVLWLGHTAVIIYAGALLFFFLFIKYPGIFSHGIFRALNKAGVASYFLYLIHENIGVLLINRYGGSFHGFSGLFPIMVIVALCLFSVWFYGAVEMPVSKYLKKIMFKERKTLNQ